MIANIFGNINKRTPDKIIKTNKIIAIVNFIIVIVLILVVSFFLYKNDMIKSNLNVTIGKNSFISKYQEIDYIDNKKSIVYYNSDEKGIPYKCYEETDIDDLKHKEITVFYDDDIKCSSKRIKITKNYPEKSILYLGWKGSSEVEWYNYAIFFVLFIMSFTEMIVSYRKYSILKHFESHKPKLLMGVPAIRKLKLDDEYLYRIKTDVNVGNNKKIFISGWFKSENSSLTSGDVLIDVNKPRKKYIADKIPYSFSDYFINLNDKKNEE